MSVPSKTMVPLEGSTWPAIALSSVDLPAPFAPMTARVSPFAQREVDAVDGLEVAVVDVERRDLQQGHAASPRSKVEPR